MVSFYDSLFETLYALEQSMPWVEVRVDVMHAVARIACEKCGEVEEEPFLAALYQDSVMSRLVGRHEVCLLK